MTMLDPPLLAIDHRQTPFWASPCVDVAGPRKYLAGNAVLSMSVNWDTTSLPLQATMLPVADEPGARHCGPGQARGTDWLIGTIEAVVVPVRIEA